MADRPTIEWTDNIQQDFHWKFDGVEPYKTGENSYGKWYLFSVSVDDVDTSMFAKQDLMDQLEALSPTLRTGDFVSIKPVKTGKQARSWHLWVNEKPAEDQPSEPAKSEPTKNQPTLVDLGELMSACLCQAGRAWDDRFKEFQGDTAGAIERLAVTLYLDARKHGIMPMDQTEESPEESPGESPEEPPMPNEPPNPGTGEDDDLPF